MNAFKKRLENSLLEYLKIFYSSINAPLFIYSSEHSSIPGRLIGHNLITLLNPVHLQYSFTMELNYANRNFETR